MSSERQYLPSGRIHIQNTEGDTHMKNVEMQVEGNILTIKVDLTKEFGPSSSGKTIIIASTEGNVSVPGDEDKKVGLNVYRKKDIQSVEK
jgi:hypothetical protein